LRCQHTGRAIVGRALSERPLVNSMRVVIRTSGTIVLHADERCN
jgi:hypothetical protein